jgi:hypothetical protein
MSLSKTIRDLNGDAYVLNKTRLYELPKKHASRYIILRELQASLIAGRDGGVPVRYEGCDQEPVNLRNKGTDFIGCKPFAAKTYNKIIKAAKEAK